MEDHSLLGRGEGARGPSKLLIGILSFLLLATVTTTIVFGVLYAHEKNANKNPPVPPTPAPSGDYDHSNDFPLNALTPWNISTYNPKSITFTTTNGTWLNIDVSPDGQTLVFDMLGDLYQIPAVGGQATPLRTGPAFETQARFSPDGSKLLFTSDQSGVDNIWIMDLASKQQTQVTFEGYHFVSNAFWASSTTIVAVKVKFGSMTSPQNRIILIVAKSFATDMSVGEHPLHGEV